MRLGFMVAIVLSALAAFRQFVVSAGQPNITSSYDRAAAAFDRGDYAAAFADFKPLAEQGNATAQSYLGWMYNNGKGVQQSDAEALKWHRMAADQGNATAQNNLGVMYFKGDGVPQDYAKALELYRAAALQKNAYAQRNLGLNYRDGFGVKPDFTLAHMWLSLALENGQPEAEEERDAIAELLLPQDVAKAQALARECLESNYTNCP